MQPGHQASGAVDESYEAQIAAWRDHMEQRIRADDGWLTWSGLSWLREGSNSAGSDPTSDVILPESAPTHAGVIRLEDGRLSFIAAEGAPVVVDGASVRVAPLRDELHPEGPSFVDIGAVRFFVIRREDRFAVRVLNRDSAARQSFTGRQWFPVDPRYRLEARFVPHVPTRTMEMVTSEGLVLPKRHLGRAEFTLDGRTLALEAIDGGDEGLWFIFRDQTSGRQTYSGGRFLYTYSQPDSENRVVLDFNMAYHPACVFTPYATCPLPPPGNDLPIPIEAGERF